MDTDKLKSMLMKTEKQLQDYLHNELVNKGYKVAIGKDDQGKTMYIYATQEESLPVLLIAHTDIAHDYPPKEIYYDDIDGVLISPTGLGADDRAGVYAVMELIRRHRCDVLFTAGEEKGMIGAKHFIEKYKTNSKYHMLVQLDNPGQNGAMFYDCNALDFKEYILGFGYEVAYGKGTDIKVIAPQWRVNAVNLSMGYYNNHKKYEHLNLEHFKDAIERVNRILSAPVPFYEYKEISNLA